MSLPMGTPPKLIRSLDELHYKVKFMAELLIKKCNEQNIPIIITQTYRTKETQQEYYSWGRTKINPFKKNMTKVTNLDGVKKISRHQTGLAFDICMGIKGKEYDRALLDCSFWANTASGVAPVTAAEASACLFLRSMKSLTLFICDFASARSI